MIRNGQSMSSLSAKTGLIASVNKMKTLKSEVWIHENILKIHTKKGNESVVFFLNGKHLNYDNICLINRRSIDILFISFKTIRQEQHERIYSFREVELIYFSIFTNFLSAARACLTLRWAISISQGRVLLERLRLSCRNNDDKMFLRH